MDSERNSKIFIHREDRKEQTKCYLRAATRKEAFQDYDTFNFHLISYTDIKNCTSVVIIRAPCYVIANEPVAPWAYDPAPVFSNHETQAAEIPTEEN